MPKKTAKQRKQRAKKRMNFQPPPMLMMNGQPMLNYQFNPQHALMAQQQQILQNQVFEHQRYVHNTQNFIQKQFQEIQQLKEIIAQKGKKIGSNVVNWSQELPPSLPKSLRHRIFNIFMRDTNELENLMKPKNGLKISKNFINFGNRNSKKILRNNNNNNSNINQPEDDIIIASESLTIDIVGAATRGEGGGESNMLSKYYLTGITKTDNNKNKKKKQIFKHKISNGANMPYLLNTKKGLIETEKIKIQINLCVDSSFSGGLKYEFLLFEFCEITCTQQGVQYNHFVIATLMMVYFESFSLSDDTKDNNDEKNTKLNIRAQKYVPMEKRKIFSLPALSLNSYPLRTRYHDPFLNSIFQQLKKKLKKRLYEQTQSFNKMGKLPQDLIWPNHRLINNILNPERLVYSVRDEMLLAGPYANAWARNGNEVLTSHHYLCHWIALLNVEELRIIADLKELDIHNISFLKVKLIEDKNDTHDDKQKLDQNQIVRCTLNLPGVDEQRPFLSMGMEISCRTLLRLDKNQAYELIGYIVRRNSTFVTAEFLVSDVIKYIMTTKTNPNIDNSTLTMAYKEKLISDIQGTKFHLRYTYQTDYYEAMRLALFLMVDKNGRDPNKMKTLFPSGKESLLKSLPIGIQKSIHESKIMKQWKDRNDICNHLDERQMWVDGTVNLHQKISISMILSKENGLAPIVIHGPPGTGKTKTVVEAVNQIINLNLENAYTNKSKKERDKSKTSPRILLTAPSDIACDVLCSRLTKTLHEKYDMLRMNLPQRQVNEIVLMDVLNHCHISKTTGSFEIPEVTELKKYKVIICTCAAAALFLANHHGFIDMFSNHFQYIFIDEAGQALEPEALIPISIGRLNKGIASIVLSGDPKQLEAQVRSPIAGAFRFGKSLQERLMSMPLYNPKNIQQSKFCFIQLNLNYRSHIDILNFSSTEFYDGSLHPKANDAKANKFLNWEGVRISKASGKPFPLIIYDIAGEERLDQGSISFYNIEEANAIVKIIQDLLKSEKVQCTASDIAVLCAYWQQVRLVRKYLRQMGLGAIRVGVVDDYQGQESAITIVSCVLTQPRQQVDILSPLTGLLGNVKRVNVALTRAMGLSIVVASASFLKSDMYFQRLLKYCWKNNSVYTDRNLNEFIVTEDDIDDETKNIHMTTATASDDKNNNKKKETLKDYDDYEDDEDLILNHLKDFAVLNLNDVNNAFGTSDFNGSSYMALEFDAFYKEEKPFKGNSL